MLRVVDFVAVVKSLSILNVAPNEESNVVVVENWEIYGKEKDYEEKDIEVHDTVVDDWLALQPCFDDDGGDLVCALPQHPAC